MLVINGLRGIKEKKRAKASRSGEDFARPDIETSTSRQ
jgi:hypothetical protein